jgi:hypothetical protein
LRRLAILLVAIVAAGVLTVGAASPAAALSACSTRAIAPSGPHPAGREIRLTVCKGDVLLGDYWYWEHAQLWIGSQSTGATGCSISLWTRLYGGGVGWNGPSFRYDCRRTLRANATHTYSGTGAWTTASGMIAHSCLTLWYGSQKGSPFCWESRLAGI